MKRSVVLFFASFILLPCSCGQADSNDPSHSFQVYEEDGIAVAETQGGPKYALDLFHYKMAAVLEPTPDDPVSIVTVPHEIYNDESGRYYVVDGGDRNIAVFNQTGQYLRRIGSRGEGPGEFSLPSIQRVSGDTVFVFDNYLRRHSVFLSSGVLIEVAHIPLGIPGSTYSCDRLLDGRYLVYWRGWRDQGGIRYSTSSVTCFSAAGDSLYTIGTEWVPIFYVFNLPFISSSAESAENYPFSGFPVTFYHEDEIGITTGLSPYVMIYDLQGRLRRRISLITDSIPVSQQDRSVWRRRIDHLITSSQGLNKGRYKAMKDALTFPEKRSYWKGAKVDDRGFVWLEHRIFQVDGQKDRLEIWVLDPSGEFIGTTILPEIQIDKYWCVVRGQLLAFVENQDTGELVPTVYNLEPAAKGLKY